MRVEKIDTVQRTHGASPKPGVKAVRASGATSELRRVPEPARTTRLCLNGPRAASDDGAHPRPRAASAQPHSEVEPRRLAQNNDNEHSETVAGFGDEWSRFDQSGATDQELECTFDKYFAIFPWARLLPAARGVDVGCGSGRWARLVAPRVGQLDCVDASAEALAVARRNLRGHSNVNLTQASVGALPFESATFDFAYSLGVLHHVPDTLAGMRECVRILKPGAPFLVYLYYALDNRPAWYRNVWRASDAVRRIVCKLPRPMRHAVAEIVAASVYWPLARSARLGEHLGLDVESVPLASYRQHSFYVMRNDALDRMGTPLEQRFSRVQIEGMMRQVGLTDVRFHDSVPFWCAVGFKQR